ncbi:MAG: translation elongation factor 4 [Chitinivibrionales bacterium]
MSDIESIRNFSIIAHIDHGKSTISDRFLELTKTVEKNRMHDQVLDDMDLEKERGITVKSHPVRMRYPAEDGREYVFNLIDTPGHVDFSYEVSRSLKACEGAIVVVDAAQGIEAQTMSNIFLAMENDLHIIPVLNKIDLPAAKPVEVGQQIADLLGIERTEILECSGKTGEGIKEILEAVVQEIPPPKGDSSAPLKALVFDSVFDSYRGAVAYIRVFEGSIRKKTNIKYMSSDKVFETDEVGIFHLKRKQDKALHAGETGYVIANIKDIKKIKIGDTITDADNPTDKPVPGYKEVKPVVFSGIYPIDKGEYDELRSALDKLSLNDPSITYAPESSNALGFGFRSGFLGLLHMEIVQERLKREFGVDIITTIPSVKYLIKLKNGEEIYVESPVDLPDESEIETFSEPVTHVQILTHSDFVGSIMKLCEEKRGKLGNMEYLNTTQVNLHYDIPLSELIVDFFEKLKSCSRGYASLDYEITGYVPEDLMKLNILINGDPVDSFSAIVHREEAYAYGQSLTRKLKELIPRQMYDVAIQAAAGNRVIARTTVKALRKDVTSKCYGGDVSRKRKLLEKQKEGKKRMKQVGSIEIPQEAFLAVLSRE